MVAGLIDYKASSRACGCVPPAIFPPLTQPTHGHSLPPRRQPPVPGTTPSCPPALYPALIPTHQVTLIYIPHDRPNYSCSCTTSSLRPIPAPPRWLLIHTLPPPLARTLYPNCVLQTNTASVRVLPANERNQLRWNGDPHQLDGGSGMSEGDPGVWLLPYWLGRYIGVVSASD